MKGRVIPAALLVALLMPAASAANASRSERIAGGPPVPTAEYPFVLGVDFFTASGGYGCTGSAISPHWVLTAAHCVYSADSALVYYIPDQGGPSSRTVEVVRAVVHPGYTPERFDFDAALVNTRQALDVPAVPLARADQGSPPVGAEVTALGRGNVSFTDPGDGRLRKATLPVQESSVCDSEGAPGVFAPAIQFCAGPNAANSEAVCLGDNGGPAVDGTGTQVGIASYVLTNSGDGCFGHAPSYFTRVDSLREWIDRTAFYVRGGAVRDKEKGTAALRYEAPGPGRVSIAGTRALKPTHSRVIDGAGSIDVLPTAEARRKLAQRGKLVVVARISYAPDGGQAVKTGRQVTLEKR